MVCNGLASYFAAFARATSADVDITLQNIEGTLVTLFVLLGLLHQPVPRLLGVRRRRQICERSDSRERWQREVGDHCREMHRTLTLFAELKVWDRKLLTGCEAELFGYLCKSRSRLSLFPHASVQLPRASQSDETESILCVFTAALGLTRTPDASRELDPLMGVDKGAVGTDSEDATARE